MSLHRVLNRLEKMLKHHEDGARDMDPPTAEAYRVLAGHLREDVSSVESALKFVRGDAAKELADIRKEFGIPVGQDTLGFLKRRFRQNEGLWAARFFNEKLEWSLRTFGPGDRAKGVVAHIRKELLEIEAEPHSLDEWCDVVLLAMDGAARSAGADGATFVRALIGKQLRNTKRMWPDWRGASADVPIEHNREEGGR